MLWLSHSPAHSCHHTQTLPLNTVPIPIALRTHVYIKCVQLKELLGFKKSSLKSYKRIPIYYHIVCLYILCKHGIPKKWELDLYLCTAYMLHDRCLNCESQKHVSGNNYNEDTLHWQMFYLVHNHALSNEIWQLKPTNGHKCMKVCYKHTYTSYMFWPLMWPSLGRCVTKERYLKILQQFVRRWCVTKDRYIEILQQFVRRWCITKDRYIEIQQFVRRCTDIKY